MQYNTHIPLLANITDFYNLLRIGQPQSNDFSIMRIEDQPATKRKTMPLFRCNFYRLVFFRNAGVDWNSPNQHFASEANSIYFSYPGKVESWVTHQKIYGYLVCFTAEFANINTLHASFGEAFPFFKFDGQPLIKFSEALATVLANTQDAIIDEMKSVYPDRMDMVRLLLHRYLMQVRRIYYSQEDSMSSQTRNEYVVFNRFRKVVDDYFAALAANKIHQQASVSLIADRMNLTPGYVNTAIKNLTGSTASSYIHQKTILEAQSYLMHTGLQIAEIAHRLGFTNVSYFNRFFKKHTQETPSVYKNQHQRLA